VRKVSINYIIVFNSFRLERFLDHIRKQLQNQATFFCTTFLPQTSVKVCVCDSVCLCLALCAVLSPYLETHRYTAERLIVEAHVGDRTRAKSVSAQSGPDDGCETGPEHFKLYTHRPLQQMESPKITMQSGVCEGQKGRGIMLYGADCCRKISMYRRMWPAGPMRSGAEPPWAPSALHHTCAPVTRARCSQKRT
jgi:hypothetical protein